MMIMKKNDDEEKEEEEAEEVEMQIDRDGKRERCLDLQSLSRSRQYYNIHGSHIILYNVCFLALAWVAIPLSHRFAHSMASYQRVICLLTLLKSVEKPYKEKLISK